MTIVAFPSHNRKRGFVSDQSTTQFKRVERTEAALRLSEATKTAILEAALDCIVTIDSQGLVVDWNPAAARTFGYSSSEAIGKEMAELIIPHRLRPMHRQGLARAVSTHHDHIAGKRIEITACRKNGEEFPVELAITRIAAGALPLFTGHIRDISARKEAEQRRAAELSVIRALAQAASLTEAAPQVLQAVCECLHWDLGAIWRRDQATRSLHCAHVWHAPHLRLDAFVSATLASQFASGTGLPGRIWARCEPEWIADVTKDPNFPRAELAAEHSLHAAFGFPIRLGREVLGVIEFFSRSIREPNPEVLDTFSAIGSQIGQFIERNEAEEAVYRMNSDLEKRIANATAKLRASQQRLRSALAQEKELNGLKSNFVNLVSHEFRTPLGVILSSTDILASYQERLDAQQRAEHLEDIRHATRQMAGLMEEVLLLGRVEAGKMHCRPQHFSLSEFCRRVVDEQLSASNSKCPIQLELSVKQDSVHGDESLLRHILLNLLSNAVKYSPSGRAVELLASRRGAHAVFEVKDQGIGIPLPDQARLFETFHRAGNVGDIPGTGLGLVIVKRCVDLHGGKIAVTSQTGHGTNVTVTLPLFQNPRKAEGKSKSTRSKVRLNGNSHTVLKKKS